MMRFKFTEDMIFVGTANAEESASASEEMSAQAEQLKDYVSELVMMITGNNNQENTVGRHHKIKTVSSKSLNSKRQYIEYKWQNTNLKQGVYDIP